MQKKFVDSVVEKIRNRSEVIGLAAAGSWITNELDEYSDVDLILVTKNAIAPDAEKMKAFAEGLGELLSGFTGEHVGEPRLLICLYDNPLLHVDIKFLILDELTHRIEDPVVIWERDGALSKIISSTKSAWPALDYQWIEDRFWTWVHYATVKLGRGENFEALEFMSFARMTVIAPLLQIKNKKLPRGMRRVEFNFPTKDVNKLIDTVPHYSTKSIFDSLDKTIALYQELRTSLYPPTVTLGKNIERITLEYLNNIKSKRIQ